MFKILPNFIFNFKNEEEQVRLQEVLHEFSETFDETTKPINKLFLRGEVVQAGSKTGTTLSC